MHPFRIPGTATAAAVLLGLAAAAATAAETAPTAQLETIRQTIDRAGFCSADDLALLWKRHRDQPGDTEVRAVLTLALLAREDWDGLVDLFSAEAGASGAPADRLFLAKVLVKGQRYAEARRTVEPLLGRSAPAVEAEWVAAFADFHLGEHDRAAGILDAGRERLLAAGFDDALLLRGLVHLHRHELDRAVAVLSELLRRDPQHVSGHNALGRALAAAGRTEEARRHLEAARRALAERNADESRRARLSSRSKALNEARAEGRVDDCARLVATMLPDADDGLRSRLHLYLSEVYREHGRAREADEERQKAIRLGGGS